MMVDEEFHSEFQKFLEDEFKNLNERLISNRHKGLEEVCEVQGKIRMLREVGAKFKDMVKAMYGGKHAA